MILTFFFTVDISGFFELCKRFQKLQQWIWHQVWAVAIERKKNPKFCLLLRSICLMHYHFS